jgi:hypothetical protein
VDGTCGAVGRLRGPGFAVRGSGLRYSCAVPAGRIGPSLFAIAVTAAIVALASSGCRRTGASTLADLVTQFPSARKQPAEAAFQISDVSIDGVTKPSLIAGQTTRLTYHVTLPKHATFTVSVAVDPEAWNSSGQGVLFLIGISDGQSYQTKRSIPIDPFAQPNDRRWHDVTVSLEEFAGLTVDIVLNTRAVGDGGAPGHVAVWGTPTVVVR